MGGFFGASAPAEQGLGGGFFGKFTSAPTVTLDALVDLAFSDSTHLVGVTATGNAAWSADGGVTTHAVIAPVATINVFHIVVADGAGHAVALGEDPNLGRRLVTTTDGGQTWADTTPAAMVGGAQSLYYSTTVGLFVATAAANNTRVFSSADGVTWIQHVVAVGAAPTVTVFIQDTIVETGGLIYVGGSGINRSADGLTFANVKPNILGGSYASGPVLNGTVFGVGLVAAFFPQIIQFFTSPDGTTWTLKSNAVSPFTIPPYLALQVYNGFFVTGINSGDLQTFASSPDAVTWTDHTAAVSGFKGNSAPVFLPTVGALYLFGAGVVHTPDFLSYTLDVAVTNTVNNMKALAGHVVGCGADAGGNGLFFTVL